MGNNTINQVTRKKLGLAIGKMTAVSICEIYGEIVVGFGLKLGNKRD